MGIPYVIAVKAILFDENERVLVLQKPSKQDLGKEHHRWDFPGGGLEPGETLLQALSREVFEETGLTIRVIAPAYVYDEIQEKRHLIITKFVCHQATGTFRLSSEHEAYQWFPTKALPHNTLPRWMEEEISQAYQLYRQNQKNNSC